ncbi:XAP5, circadian clock regulator-domain-containing protein [Mycena galopus ATCC 62051]|nr:XAP5, circadian clock regulator-domain-containing protein [Mycena galopus ATCC 62051]
MSAGNKAEGRREDALIKQRMQMHEEYQRKKEALINETEKARPSASRFVGQNDSLDDALKNSTVGLVHLEDFQRKRAELEEAKAREAAKTNALKDDTKKMKKRKKAAKATLSFAMDDEEADGEAAEAPRDSPKPAASTSKDEGELEEDGPPAKRGKFRKNPNVDTNEITYSYWDGSGHRKSVNCKKGDQISTFLEKCRQQFPELRGVSTDNLMYIKEDLIIPHASHYTFYDFIINKARGKSGPLFNFDVHDDVRLLADATKEKDESHAGKVVERSYYGRNKHIFPASRWEKNYGKYTIA